jgi:hypothetical protein
MKGRSRRKLDLSTNDDLITSLTIGWTYRR